MFSTFANLLLFHYKQKKRKKGTIKKAESTVNNN